MRYGTGFKTEQSICFENLYGDNLNDENDELKKIFNEGYNYYENPFIMGIKPALY